MLASLSLVVHLEICRYAGYSASLLRAVPLKGIMLGGCTFCLDIGTTAAEQLHIVPPSRMMPPRQDPPVRLSVPCRAGLSPPPPGMSEPHPSARLINGDVFYRLSTAAAACVCAAFSADSVLKDLVKDPATGEITTAKTLACSAMAGGAAHAATYPLHLACAIQRGSREVPGSMTLHMSWTQ